MDKIITCLMVSQFQSQAEKYISENRIQALRDLESANIILGNNGNLENVAFLLEQSYEKILKAAHGQYRLEIKGDILKNVHKDAHSHDIGFAFQMLKDIHEYFYQAVMANPLVQYNILAQYPHLSKPAKKIASSLEDIIAKVISDIERIKRKVEAHIRNKSRFTEFLSGLDENSIREPNLKANYVVNYPKDTNVNAKLNTMINAVMPNEKTLNKYARFLALLCVLAPYTLPHVIASRYPISECKMENLRAYRTDSKDLRKFFKKLAIKIKILLDSEEEFVAQIKNIYVINQKLRINTA